MHRPVSPWTLPADLRRGRAIAEGGAGGGFRPGEYHPPGYPAVLLSEQSSNHRRRRRRQTCRTCPFWKFCCLFVFVAKGVSPLADVRDVNYVGDDR